MRRTHQSCLLREMKFSEYASWFHAEHAMVIQKLEPRCTEIGPFLTPTVVPDKPPWKAEWAVVFEDEHFFRVTENWFRRGIIASGGSGYREHFSFHYGLANPVRGSDGLPVRSNAYPAIFRIDRDRHGPHLHFGGDDHIPQTRVQNLRISNVEPFDFVRAVLRHRSTREDFDQILKFKVTK
jgi:hypothetical protein